ncbi:hypothetical protein F3Y22_tig00110462pilonHSYRG00109 [Hibiscus syriacus]|uniref:Uncharacterized protein n=1 Tax=Hibiscus syriacus TaxID=106335 RepID=A0A6A3AGV4_HIBSY|nr:hypothetical protein F3Y22_tig00110462pilonHSYRG00109 [Hibiscus syriacus]
MPKNDNPHAALLSSPGMGHLIPVMELGKRMTTHHDFHVTIFFAASDHGSTTSLLKSPTLENLNIVTLPSVDISSLVGPNTQLVEKLLLIMRESLPSLRSSIAAMKFRPSALIVDLFGADAFEIAEEFGMLKYVFNTTNAWYLAAIFRSSRFDGKFILENHVKGQKPLEIPSCNSLSFEDTPESLHNIDSVDRPKFHGAKMINSRGILINTWEDLESSTIEALRDNKYLGTLLKVPIYPMEPLRGDSIRKQMTELAWGLEQSQQKFIWVVRPPSINAVGAYFSIGNMKGMSLRITCHKSIMKGVPMIAWPLYAEQKMNAKMLTEDFEIDVRPNVSTTEERVGRGEIKNMVRTIMADRKFKYGINRHQSWDHTFLLSCVIYALLNFCFSMDFAASSSRGFTNKKVNVVLDETNFLLWKQQILLTIRSHQLERLLTGGISTPPMTTLDANGELQVNEAYEDFIAQDSALASWLLSTVSTHLLPQFVGAETAAAVWETILKFFAKRSTMSVMSLHYKLQSIRKGNDSMRMYLTRIKEVCDTLASCGSNVPPVEQIVSILRGLPREYQPFMVVVSTTKDALSVDNIHTMLLDVEVQFAGFDEQQDSLPISANYAHGDIDRGSSNHQENRSGRGSSGGRNGGRGRTRVQCQLCGKLGHLVDRCWHSTSQGCECCSRVKTDSQANVATATSERWVVDSGATHHVTPDRTNLGNSTDFHVPETTACIAAFATSTEGISPSEKLLGKKPNYNDLKVFGCQCYPHLRPFQVHKLAYRSQSCTYLGVSPQHRGFQCLVADERVYISRHVVFNETTFPFAGSPSSCNAQELRNRQPQTLQIVTNMHHQPAQLLAQPATQGSVESVPTGSHDIKHVNIEGGEGESSSVAMPPGITLEPSLENVPRNREASQISPNPHGVPPSVEILPIDTTRVNNHNSPAKSNSDVVPSSVEISPTGTSRVNNHPMLMRSKCGIFKLKALSCHFDEEVPSNVTETLQSPAWTAAVQEEFDALQRNGTWTLVKLPPGRVAVGCKWLFKVKRNPDGSVHRYKARLVANGFFQVFGQDYLDTFSPVVKFTTLNVILSVAVANNWELRHVDINNAFLNGDLKEAVFMKQPPGFEQTTADGEPLVCQLQKALYGLKQTPRNWYAKLKDVLLLPNDIVITSSSTTSIANIVRMLQDTFSLKDLGPLSYFLDIEVKRNNGSLMLSQKKFVLDLLKKTGMENASTCATPMILGSKLAEDGDLIKDATMYRSIVGSLLYMCHIRPELAFSVGKVAQFMHAPRESHLVAVKRILRYLAGTVEYGLVYLPLKSRFIVSAFADADWGANITDRMSISGYGVFLGNHLVAWSSKKQKFVSRSTMEAEYKSLADAIAEVTWASTLLAELGLQQHGRSVIWCDNTGAVAMSANPVYHAQSKHVDLDVHFIREKVAAQQLSVNYVPAAHQLADGFTKPLSKAAFEMFHDNIGVQVSSQSEEENKKK